MVKKSEIGLEKEGKKRRKEGKREKNITKRGKMKEVSPFPISIKSCLFMLFNFLNKTNKIL